MDKYHDLVPIVMWCSLTDAIETMKEEFKSVVAVNDPNLVAEGVVGYPRCMPLTRTGERVIVKLKHKDLKDI